MKPIRLLVLALCMAGLLQGCGNKSGGSARDTSRKKFQLAFVANGTDDFWSIVRLGCDNAVLQLGDVDLNSRFLVNRTAEEQQEVARKLVASGVDGIVISPIDADNQTDFLNEMAAKTHLVCINSDAEKSKRGCFIGSDNLAAGRQAAALLKAALPQGGKVCLFVGYSNAQDAKARIQGIKEALAGSNLQIVDTFVDETKLDVARQNVADALKRYPDVAGLFGLYAYNGPAILEAVRGAGKAGQVKIVCFDTSSDTLAGIAAGDIYATIVQRPFEFSLQSIMRLEKCLRGDKTQLTGEKILIPTRVITKDNVAAFQNELKILLQQ